jgi:hypothetical protein
MPGTRDGHARHRATDLSLDRRKDLWPRGRLLHPLNVDGEDPPDYMLHNELQSGYWRRAWALRCELESKQ